MAGSFSKRPFPEKITSFPKRPFPVSSLTGIFSDTTFPSDLPIPKDDGLYNHLTHLVIPSDISLPVARDPTTKFNLSGLEGLTVVFCYPRTGRCFSFQLVGMMVMDQSQS